MLGEYATFAILGFIIPVLTLLLAWRAASTEIFTAVTVSFAALTYLGMGKTIPLLGMEVSGGSTYLPAMYLTLALSIKTLGVQSALRILVASSFAVGIFAAAQARWLIFAEVYPDMTSHSLAAHTVHTRNAVLTLLLLYFGGLMFLAAYRMLRNSAPILRLTVPVLLDILLTTPISMLTVYWTRSEHTPDWETLVVHTILARMVLPAIVIPIVHYASKGDNYAASTQRKPIDISSGASPN